MKKSLIVGIIFFLIIITLVGYFFIRNNNGDDLITQKNKLQSDLVVAQNKLNKEKNILKVMTSDLRNSFPLATSVQDQMEKGSKIVNQTDFMFTDPNGLNPQLIVKNFPTIVLINKERKDINLLLIEWQNKNNIFYTKKVDIKESEQIKKDAQTIKTYLKDLSSLVRILTPKNSGISQFQIDSYLSNLPSEEVINEVLISLQTAIDNSQTSNIQTSLNPSSIHLVTSDEVVVQQGIVDQAQAQVIALQEQLAQVEEQIQQSLPTSTSTPTPISPPTSNSDIYSPPASSFDVTPNSVDISSASNPNVNSTYNSTETNTNTQTNSDLENQNTNTDINQNTTNTDNTNSSNTNSTDNHRDIIIQPGLPQLIQGTNQY